MPLAQALRRHCQWLCRGPGRLRELLGRGSGETEGTAREKRISQERARFWAEVRQGRREAEAKVRGGNERVRNEV